MNKILPVIFGIFLCLALIPSAGSCKDNPKAKEVTAEAADKLIREKPANLVILDVRTPGEFREGHIAGAKNMDFFWRQNLMWILPACRKTALSLSIAEAASVRLAPLRNCIKSASRMSFT